VKIVTCLPTYNEADNIVPLIQNLLAVSTKLEVLVIDDDSPDGTWKLVEAHSADNPRVHLLHRKTERGRGSAGVAGFKRALEMGADLVIEMDADWSHHPRYLREMIRSTQRADVIVGSRLVPGGSETGRNFIRTLITYGANLYLKILLNLPVRDCTSGYRVFRRYVLENIDWDRVQATGPSIVQEVLLAAHALGAKMTEVPIVFEERRAGVSTFNFKILVAGLLAPWRLRFRQPAV